MLHLPRISAHARQRWTERVDDGANYLAAELALLRFLKAGKVRPTPRHWVSPSPVPGTVYVFSANHPGVCVLVREGVAVTVLTRGQARRHRIEKARPCAGTRRRPQPVPPLAWDLDEAA